MRGATDHRPKKNQTQKQCFSYNREFSSPNPCGNTSYYSDLKQCLYQTESTRPRSNVATAANSHSNPNPAAQRNNAFIRLICCSLTAEKEIVSGLLTSV